MEKFTIEQCAIFTSCFFLGALAGYKLKVPLRTLGSLVTTKPTKLVIVVREDLKLGTGKLISQCCHGTLCAYMKGMKTHSKLIHQWEFSGQPKVVVKTKTLQEMLKIKKEADAIGISTHLIKDAGKTQVIPGTETVLSVGPDVISKIDGVTGHLKLL